MKRFLKSGSFFCLVFLITACGNPYKRLTKSEQNVASVLQFKPNYQKELYRCLVNGKFLFKKFHLSGLLFFKQTDSAVHAVFQNEMGINFFNFEWDKEGKFTVHQIIPQLDKPALVKTLQKDLQLLLMNELNEKSEQQFVKGNECYHRFDLDKGWAYYITKGNELNRIEVAGKSKVTAIAIGEKNTQTAMPETVFIKHYKANFTIQLQKIEPHVDE